MTGNPLHPVVPAKAGTQCSGAGWAQPSMRETKKAIWIPACAGMTNIGVDYTFAGMTNRGCGSY